MFYFQLGTYGPWQIWFRYWNTNKGCLKAEWNKIKLKINQLLSGIWALFWMFMLLVLQLMSWCWNKLKCISTMVNELIQSGYCVWNWTVRMSTYCIVLHCYIKVRSHFLEKIQVSLFLVTKDVHLFKPILHTAGKELLRFGVLIFTFGIFLVFSYGSRVPLNKSFW